MLVSTNDLHSEEFNVTPTYIYKDPPNLEDPTLHSFAFQVQLIRSAIAKLLPQIFIVNEPISLHQGITFGILDRLCELSLSIEVLAMKGRTRDAAVLLASVFEMHIDMKYMALNTKRLEEWASHTSTWRKPWKFDLQLKELFPAPKDLEAERDIYHRYCMIKHGSPVLETSQPEGLSFLSTYSVLVDGQQTALQLDRLSCILPVFLFGLGCHLCDAGFSALHILSEQGMSFPDIQDELDTQHKSLNKLSTDHITQLAYKLLSSQTEEHSGV